MSALRACSHVLCILFLGWALLGCASVRVDDEGRTHIAGLVWLTLPAVSQPGTAAHVVRARSVGVSVQRGHDSGSLTIGYSDQTLATIYNDSVVRLPPGAQGAGEER